MASNWHSEFYYRCPKCKEVWSSYKQLPLIRVPGLTSFPSKCPECGKSAYPYKELTDERPEV